MTQEDLAGYVGISVDTLKRYESGKTPVRSDVLFQIALTLGVPVQDLFPAEPGKEQKREQDKVSLEKEIEATQVLQRELQNYKCFLEEKVAELQLFE